MKKCFQTQMAPEVLWRIDSLLKVHNKILDFMCTNEYLKMEDKTWLKSEFFVYIL